VNTVVFPCPAPEGKGVLVAPTAHGNIIVGPDQKVAQKNNFANTAAALAFVRWSSQRCVPSINFRASIRNFTGIRAAGNKDFIVGESAEVENFFNIAGIKSPGLTAAPAIAKEVGELLREKGLSSEANPRFVAKRNVLRFKDLTADEKARAVKKNPRYGTIICRCQTVSEGEIIDALSRPLPPRSLDALKRRCLPGMGRCQGGFCNPKALSLIAERFNLRAQDVPLDKAGMYIVTGETKGGAK
jgi:glycerol-3-phosphate dehydrogenase